MSQHEKAGDLPLVTESAVVTDITVMDHDRKDEVTDAVTGRVEGEVPGSDGGVDWGALMDESGGDVREELVELRERYERSYPALMSVKFRTEEKFDFVAGQYVTMRFHETPRPYSLASSPNDDGYEVCIKRVPGGRLTSELFEDLREGMELMVRGPNGDFMLQEHSSRDIAFLATGTGVAPIRSMVRYLFQEGRDTYEGRTREVWLFLGASWRDDLPYMKEFMRIDDKKDNFHFIPTLSREHYLTDWDGETEYVQETFMKYLDDTGDRPTTSVDAEIDTDSLDVYACGVSAMVQSVVERLRDSGVPDERIEAEGYG